MADEDIRDAAHAGRERRHDKTMKWAVEADKKLAAADGDSARAIFQRAAEPLLALARSVTAPDGACRVCQVPYSDDYTHKDHCPVPAALEAMEVDGDR